MFYFLLASIAVMLALNVLFVLGNRPRGIRDRKGPRAVWTWAAWSAVAVVCGGLLGWGSMWVFRWLMILIGHHFFGAPRAWCDAFGIIMGAALGLSMTAAIGLGINESYEDPAKVRRDRRRGRPRPRKKPRLPG